MSFNFLFIFSVGDSGVVIYGTAFIESSVEKIVPLRILYDSFPW